MTFPAKTSPPTSRFSSGTFRHDLRNALAPALLCADALTSHSDKKVRQNAEMIVESLEKAMDLLKKTTSSR
ncbi:hypothetical protein [Gluconobacter morbifer]|nr:hypothetical protein [Gluconobacter morbifer]